MDALDLHALADRQLSRGKQHINHARRDQRERKQSHHSQRVHVLRHQVDDREQTRGAHLSDRHYRIVGKDCRDTAENEEPEQCVIKRRSMKAPGADKMQIAQPKEPFQGATPSALPRSNEARRGQ